MLNEKDGKLESIKIDLQDRTNSIIEGNVLHYKNGTIEGYTTLSYDYICGYYDQEDNFISFQIYTLNDYYDYIVCKKMNNQYVGRRIMNDNKETKMNCEVYVDSLEKCYEKEILEIQKAYLQYKIENRADIESLKRQLVLNGKD